MILPSECNQIVNCHFKGKVDFSDFEKKTNKQKKKKKK